MKSSLTLLLLLVTATCVFSGKEISVPNFIERILYQPYYSDPELLSALDRVNDKHLFIIAMYPAGGVSFRARDQKLVFPFANKVIPTPGSKLQTDHHSQTTLYHSGPMSLANPMSIWIAKVHRSSTVILQDGERIVTQFRQEQKGADPKIVIMYSHHSPSDQFTQGLIRLKNSLNIPGGATVILSYSASFEHELANRQALIAAGFIIHRLPLQNASNKSKNNNTAITKSRSQK